MKSGILVFGCAVAFAAAPMVVAAPAVAKDCPAGTVSRFEGVCTQGQSGGFGAPGLTIPPQSSVGGPVISNSPAGVGSVNNIPCTPEHLSYCIAAQQG